MKNNTFKMSVNQFADRTFEELYKQNYLDEDIFFETVDFEDFEPPNIVTVTEAKFNKTPPESFDWRDQGMNLPVKNQGYCGSCYAFVGLEAIESSFYIKSGKSFVFSRQEIVDCAEKHGTNGCDGGIVHGVYSYISKMNGISLQDDYPYKEMKSKCNENVERVKFRIKEMIDFERDDEELLKKALYNAGPINVVLDSLNDSFYRYSSGIYYEEKCNDENRMPTHAILLIGYGTENGHDFWTIKNSFGTKWGESGYMRIARNRNNHCKIASFNLIPIIDESQERDQLN
jgi:C1A family cysteine protease